MGIGIGVGADAGVGVGAGVGVDLHALWIVLCVLFDRGCVVAACG